MNEVMIHTTLPEDEELVITTKQKRKEVVPAYSCFGDNNEFNTKEPGYSKLFITLANANKPALWLFFYLADTINRKTNEAIFVATTTKEKQQVGKGYKELYNLNLVIRVHKQCYLINPKAILPAIGYYCVVKDRWNLLKPEGAI